MSLSSPSIHSWTTRSDITGAISLNKPLDLVDVRRRRRPSGIGRRSRSPSCAGFRTQGNASCATLGQDPLRDWSGTARGIGTPVSDGERPGTGSCPSAPSVASCSGSRMRKRGQNAVAMLRHGSHRFLLGEKQHGPVATRALRSRSRRRATARRPSRRRRPCAHSANPLPRRRPVADDDDRHVTGRETAHDAQRIEIGAHDDRGARTMPVHRTVSSSVKLRRQLARLSAPLSCAAEPLLEHHQDPHHLAVIARMPRTDARFEHVEKLGAHDAARAERCSEHRTRVPAARRAVSATRRTAGRSRASSW